MGLILLSGVPLSSLGENTGGEPSGLTGDKLAAGHDRSSGAASMGLATLRKYKEDVQK